MNFMDSTKIISPSACEISILFRLTLLLSEITSWYTPHHHGRNPNLFFHLRMISYRSKVGRFNPDYIPFDRKNTGRD